MKQSLAYSLERERTDAAGLAKILHAEFMRSRSGTVVSDTDVMRAARSPFALFCDYHVNPALKDAPRRFARTSLNPGILLESSYAGIEKMAYEKSGDGFLLALYSMSRGADALSDTPLFCMPDGTYGTADVLERHAGASIFGNYHYAVRMIKAPGNRTRRPDCLWAAFLTMLIGRIQGHTPSLFCITDSNGNNTVPYPYKKHKKPLFDAICKARGAVRGNAPPAIYGAGAAPWSDHNDKTAIQNNDVSLIPGIGAGERVFMVERGFKTVQDVAASDIAGLLRVHGVETEAAHRYLESATAITNGAAVRKGGAIQLPTHSTDVFLDLERNRAARGRTASNYLIGALVRKNGTAKYHPFVADKTGEYRMVQSFLDFIGSQPDCGVYYWGDYETGQLETMIERHGVERSFDMVDLFPVATDAFAFPTYGNSVKDIARWIGFNWRHKDVDAYVSAELYRKYAADPKAGADGMRLALDYNEDDCVAAMVVKDWLAARASTITIYSPSSIIHASG